MYIGMHPVCVLCVCVCLNPLCSSVVSETRLLCLVSPVRQRALTIFLHRGMISYSFFAFSLSIMTWSG